MKVKKESAKARLHLNIKKIKIVIIEEIHNFNIDNEDTDFVKDFAYLGHRFKWRLQPRNQGEAETWKSSNRRIRKIIKSKDVSIEVKAKIIHSLLFPVTMYGCESWTLKKADRKKLIHLK